MAESYYSAAFEMPETSLMTPKGANELQETLFSVMIETSSDLVLFDQTNAHNFVAS